MAAQGNYVGNVVWVYIVMSGLMFRRDIQNDR